MKLIEFEGQNEVIAKEQPPYLPFPCHRIWADPEGRTTCCWELTWKERIKVLFTGRVWHQILTFQNKLQPQRLTVEKPELPQGDCV